VYAPLHRAARARAAAETFLARALPRLLPTATIARCHGSFFALGAARWHRRAARRQRARACLEGCGNI